jgi:hypothetical protein
MSTNLDAIALEDLVEEVNRRSKLESRALKTIVRRIAQHPSILEEDGFRNMTEKYVKPSSLWTRWNGRDKTMVFEREEEAGKGLVFIHRKDFDLEYAARIGENDLKRFVSYQVNSSGSGRKGFYVLPIAAAAVDLFAGVLTGTTPEDMFIQVGPFHAIEPLAVYIGAMGLYLVQDTIRIAYFSPKLEDFTSKGIKVFYAGEALKLASPERLYEDYIRLSKG